MQSQIGGECVQGWSLAVCVYHLQPSNPERVSSGMCVNSN